MEVGQEKEALAIWRAVQNSLGRAAAAATRPNGALVLPLDDVLAAMRGGSATTTTTPVSPAAAAAATAAAADDEPEQHERSVLLLQELWWWLFLSQGKNACLAFLDVDQRGGRAAAHSKEEREDVFLALAPAVLDRLQMTTDHSLASKQRPVLWRRVRQACCHNSDKRQAALVRILLRCLSVAGVRPLELDIEAVLHHSNADVVLGTSAANAHAHAHTFTLTRMRTHRGHRLHHHG
jgi:hypothetical protein